MTRIIPRLLLNGALLGALLCPAALYALGLGDIRLNSALSQPFDAEVELVNPTVEELSSITVGLASAEAFARFGLDRPSYLSNFVFRVTPVGRGQAVIRIVSTRPVTEPVVSFLLEVSTGSGRQLREYTVFLDPPVFVPAQPAAREQVSGVAPPPPVEPSATQGVIERAPTPEVTPQLPPPVTEPLPTPAPIERAPEPVAAEPIPEAAPPAEPPPLEPEPVTPPPLTEPEPVEPVAAETEPVVPAPTTAMPDSYDVQRGDTLWRIASQLKGADQSINQAMIAVYQANPEAFVGNINRLRAGAVLRIPSAEEMAAVDHREATSEVARQYEEWRPAPAPAPVEAVADDREHLRLVTPTEPAGATTSAAAERARAEQAAAEAAAAEKARAEEEAAKTAEAARAAAEREAQEVEAKRLLEVQNAELARMQQERERQAAEEAARAAAEATPAPAATEELVATPEQPSETQAAPADAKPAQQAPVAPPEPSFLESLVGALGQYGTYILIVVAVLLVGGTLIFFSRRRQAESNSLAFPMASGEPTLTPSDFDAVMDDIPQPMARTSGSESSYTDTGYTDTGDHAQSFEMPDEDAIEEAETSFSKAPAPKKRAEVEPGDDIMGGEPAAAVDQQDAIAEADFHMAYGLYDQAADLVKIAIGRDPSRRDLKLKLAEIYFVWGNKDLFLDAARDLHQSRSQAPAGEWDKILIMGKQIAPDDAMFKGGAIAAPGEVDVNLEGGENRVDYDLFSSPDTSQSGTVTDLDLDLAASTGTTGSQDAGDLDLLLDDVPSNSPKSKSPESVASTQEMPTIESRALPDVSAEETETELDFNLDVPSSDQTAELSIDDLGLDVGSLEASGPLKSSVAGDEAIGDEEMTRIAPAAIAPAKSSSLEPTMEVPQFDQAKRAKANGHDDEEGTETGVDTVYLEELSSDGGQSADESALMLAPADLDMDNPQLSVTDAADDDTIRSKAAREGLALESTAEMPKIRQPSAADLASTQEQPRLEIGGGGRSDVMVATTEVPELEPVTMSEVGTKLDLARAYMDMGDPDGARSILEEVLSEGNSGQRAEAQRLLDSVR